MGKSIISEGKTSTEAIEKGLKELKVSRDKVDIKILESEDKRSFFNILTPRVVKVELTLKEDEKEKKGQAQSKEIPKVTEKIRKYTLEISDAQKAKNNLTTFLEQFISRIGTGISYEVTFDEEYVYVNINGENTGKLIGYRGETLNSLQIILGSIASKGLEQKVRVILDIEKYRVKRQRALEELADKLARTVIRTGKQVTLEPMSAYERKIIHNRLQDSQRVKTHSVGDEPYRKVVITKK